LAHWSAYTSAYQDLADLCLRGGLNAVITVHHLLTCPFIWAVVKERGYLSVGLSIKDFSYFLASWRS
jgi:hypothetical protein